MYCSNCGESISEKAEICPKCGLKPFSNQEYCYHCGIKVNDKQEICVKCGVSLKRNPPRTVNKDAKDPVTMAIVSFLILGLGQILMGQVKKGVAILLLSLFFMFSTGMLVALIVYPISVIDAYKIAKKIKAGKEVGEWEFF